MKNKKNPYSVIAVLYRIAFATLIAAVIVAVSLFCIAYFNSTSKDWMAFLFTHIKDNFGDLLSGTTGLLLSLAATLFLFITFKEQRNQYEETEKREQQTRFESTYFNMLSMLQDVRESMNKAFERSNFHDVQTYVKELKTFYDQQIEEHKETNIFKELEKTKVNSAEISMAKEELGRIFGEFQNENYLGIGYFYRYIYHTIRFALENSPKFDNAIEAKEYINMLQSQLSDEELMLIFYDVLSNKGFDSKGNLRFYSLLDKNEFFENIDEQYLLDRCHHHVYPHTRFKFLNPEELEQKHSDS